MRTTRRRVVGLGDAVPQAVVPIADERAVAEGGVGGAVVGDAPGLGPFGGSLRRFGGIAGGAEAGDGRASRFPHSGANRAGSFFSGRPFGARGVAERILRRRAP